MLDGMFSFLRRSFIIDNLYTNTKQNTCERGYCLFLLVCNVSYVNEAESSPVQLTQGLYDRNDGD